MILRLLGGLLLITACGKQVNIDHTALENASKLSDKDASSALKTGTVVKMTSSNTYLQFNNNSYQISEYSSALALNFVKGLSANQTNVTFKGTVENSKMKITEINRR